jgi:RNA polymerase sigma-70 factor (ECF subfamily)
MTDKEILDLFTEKANKEKAFNLLVTKYQQKIYYQIRRILIHHEDTNDVMQNVFIKVWTSIENFRQEAQLSTWLYRISYNETMAFISKRKKENTFSFEENEEAEKKNNSIKNTLKSDEDFDGDEIQLKLQTAIGLLPDKQKIVFTMRYYDEIKYEEMAEILHTSVGALKASYHHAVKKIEEYLKND